MNFDSWFISRHKSLTEVPETERPWNSRSFETSTNALTQRNLNRNQDFLLCPSHTLWLGYMKPVAKIRLTVCNNNVIFSCRKPFLAPSHREKSLCNFIPNGRNESFFSGWTRSLPVFIALQCNRSEELIPERSSACFVFAKHVFYRNLLPPLPPTLNLWMRMLGELLRVTSQTGKFHILVPLKCI